mgnify:CR=1 FL=1
MEAQKNNLSRSDYISQYKDIAISEMHRTGIPASIKLAQALLESDNGNSTLSVKANNHFGIKCHSSWKGKVIYHDDDTKKECFRKYNSAEESFRDHSDFLTSSSRYAFLFELKSTDYKSWARGLKKAGYATNPKYDEMLIKIIQDNNLHQYDLDPGKKHKDKFPADKEFSGIRQVHKNNRVNYIVVQEGDSFESIRKEMKLLSFELFRYNDLTRDDSVYTGQILYLQPKRNKAEAGIQYHTVKQGETMYEISQLYAVKLSQLYKKNLMEYGDEPVAGQQISLRKKLKSKDGQKIRIQKTKAEKEETEEAQDEEKIIFEFEE